MLWLAVKVMKIVLFGATGNVGRRVAAEALTGSVLGLLAVGAHAARFDARAGQIITKDVGASSSTRT